MAKLTESFRYNLARLATFSGRESRSHFWPYAISILINALFVSLIAAAAVRRLHDRDRSGLWALLPLPFWIAAWTISAMLDPRAMFSPTPEDAWLYQLSMLNSLPAWGMLIWLIVLLAGEGTKGDNRYGQDSAG